MQQEKQTTKGVTKNIKLYAFNIPFAEVSMANSDLMEKLSYWLNENKGASRRRCMPLNKDSEEEDLLSNYSIRAKDIYGEITRIVPSVDVPSIPERFFDNDTFTLGDLKGVNEGKSGLAIKDHYYFMLNKSNMVTNLPKSRIKQLETYLNWLLEACRGDKLYKFKDILTSPKDIKLSDIKTINVFDPIIENKQHPQPNSSVEISTFAVDRIGPFINECPNLKQLIDREILSASLIVTFKKPRKMDEDDYKRALEAYMKPIGDADGVTFKLKNGKTIKGSDIILTKTVSVEKTENGYISEPALIQEMEQFLREIK